MIISIFISTQFKQIISRCFCFTWNWRRTHTGTPPSFFLLFFWVGQASVHFNWAIVSNRFGWADVRWSWTWRWCTLFNFDYTFNVFTVHSFRVSFTIILHSLVFSFYQRNLNRPFLFFPTSFFPPIDILIFLAYSPTAPFSQQLHSKRM